LIRSHGAIATAVHCAFDLLELDGKDLRRQPIEDRRRLRAILLHGAYVSIVLWATIKGLMLCPELAKLLSRDEAADRGQRRQAAG
jgi:hypothetical protein